MKLAEALILRADLQRKISELRQRLDRVVKVQEDEETV
ncbi:DIP1984 family protein [Chengkuizengella sediminis]|nr:DIP1984 family protein [Chengkuizengella sediminis]